MSRQPAPGSVRRLGQRFRAWSLGELADAEALIDHILYFGGVPNIQRLVRVRVGETVPELLAGGLAPEQGAVEARLGTIVHCAQVAGFTTRARFEALIPNEETHVDWFETELETIERIGVPNSLSQHFLSDGGNGR